jgi:L-aminopeptidase/D-esterase-like protein
LKGITEIAGIHVGHASDFEAMTGCTAIICDAGMVGGVEVRGSATGSEELDTLRPGHLTDRVHAVVLAGGSAFGLEAISGVRRYLERRGVGFKTSAAVVPIVSGAILYDLAIGKANVRPTREMGESAAAAATPGPVVEGCVGAGTGATVGKVLGMKNAMKAGIGSSNVELPGGVLVAALVAVNALGDVRDPDTGKLVAGVRKTAAGRDLADSARIMKMGRRGGLTGSNTTLAVVATNARLDKVQATKLAELAGVGMARTLSPAFTMFDGDIVFALSHGDKAADIDQLGIAGAEAVSAAILRAVRLAKTMGGVPGLAG